MAAQINWSSSRPLFTDARMDALLKIRKAIALRGGRRVNEILNTLRYIQMHAYVVATLDTRAEMRKKARLKKKR